MTLAQSMVAAFVVLTALCVAAYAYGRWWVRCRLRIRPSTRSRVPTTWLASTAGVARLHRRLRQAAALARTATLRDPALAPLVAELEDEAVALEPHLLAAAAAGRAGRDARRLLGEQVTAIEVVARRLACSPRAQLRPGRPDALVDLTDRLDALEAARAELDVIEARAGLGR